MAVNYTDVQKTEIYISRTNFDALEMAAVPEGTEFNIVDPIHESDLDSDVLQKLNNNAKINTANTFTAAQTFKKDITIEGNIIQNGSAYETHAEKLYTKNDMIYTRDGATAALADDAYTGIQAVKYDGTNDGQLVFGKDGVARVGDVGNTQPLATRAEAGNIVDKHLLQWDAAGQTLVDSNRTVDEFAILGSDNNFTGENRFAQEVQVQSDTAGVSVVSSAGNAFAGLLKDRCRVWDASNPTNIISSILRTESLQFRAGDTTTRYYLNKITYNKKDLLFPETEAGGTFALTEDLPVANPTAEGTVTLTKLKIGDVVYTIPSGGGDVTAAGNNTFTGNNTFEGTVNFSSITAGAVSFAGRPSFNAGIELVTGVISFRDKTATLPSVTGTLALADDNLGNVIQFKENTLIGSKCSLIRDVTTWIKNGYGSYCSPGYLVAGFGSGSSSSAAGTTAIGPNGLYKLGTTANTLKFALPDVVTTDNTLALVSDLPVANPSDAGTTTLTKLKIGDTVYNLPSGGGSGDVTAAGNNTFTGNNTFNKSVIIGNQGGSLKVSDEELSGMYSILTHNNLSFNYPSSNLSLNVSYDSIQSIAKSSDGAIILANTTLKFGQNGLTATVTVPNKTGTLALTGDIPISSATLSDNDTTLTLILR